MMRIWFVLFSFVFALNSLSLTAAKEVQSSNLYSWRIGAYTNDSSGEFSHCGASIGYQSGIYLVFAIDKTLNWRMGLANSHWRLDRGRTYTIEYQVDDLPPVRGVAETISREQVTIFLANSASLFRVFQRGRVLKVRTQNSEYSFSLDNSSAALAATLECAKRFNPTSNPFESTNKSTPSPATTIFVPASQLLNLAQGFLQSAKVTAYKMLPYSAADAELAWEYEDYSRGSLSIINASAGLTIEKWTAETIQRDSQLCNGQFSSGFQPSRYYNGLELRKLFATCTGGSNEFAFYYSMVRLPNGALVRFGAGGRMDNIQAKGIFDRADKIENAAIVLITNANQR